MHFLILLLFTTFDLIYINTGQRISDVASDCCFWASMGECGRNPFWMLPNCAESCGSHTCTVENAGECEFTVVKACLKPFIALNLTQSPETQSPSPQQNHEDDSIERILEVLPPLPGPGQDALEHCCAWASLNECLKNPFFMRTFCQRSCGTEGCQLALALECAVNVAPQCSPSLLLQATTTRTTPEITSRHSRVSNDMKLSGVSPVQGILNNNDDSSLEFPEPLSSTTSDKGAIHTKKKPSWNDREDTAHLLVTRITNSGPGEMNWESLTNIEDILNKLRITLK